MESTDVSSISLPFEQRVFKRLQNLDAFPRLIRAYNYKDYRVAIIQHPGRLFRRQSCPNWEVIAKFMVQAVSLLEQLHNCGILVRIVCSDIIGFMTDSSTCDYNKLTIWNFEFAKFLLNNRLKKKKKQQMFVESKYWRFLSESQLNYNISSKIDDLISLIYFSISLKFPNYFIKDNKEEILE